MAAEVDYAIIGGGVTGRAIALALRRRGESNVAVIERCPRDLVDNQSTRNSGVIHAGIYYKRSKQPKKARFCIEGNRMMYEFCQEFGVPHARTGKLVVATCEREEPYLLDVLQTAIENEVPGVKLLDAHEQRAIEPRIASTKSLFVPTSGVVDAAAYLDTLRRLANSHDLFHTVVEKIRPVSRGFEIFTKSPDRTERFFAKTVINAAGLYSDEIARMIDPDCGYELVMQRGEGARFDRTRRDELRVSGMNIYPVPHGFYQDGTPADVSFTEFTDLLAQGQVNHTVGVHLTPTLDENGGIAATMTVTPVIVTGVDKEDFRSVVAPDRFWNDVKAFIPGLRPTDLELHQTGIQGRLVGQPDFVIEPAATAPRFINLIAINTPGLTSSLAIARHVVDELV